MVVGREVVGREVVGREGLFVVGGQYDMRARLQTKNKRQYFEFFIYEHFRKG